MPDDGYMLCMALLVTQIDMYYVNLLLSQHHSLLATMDVEAIIAILENWQTFVFQKF